MSQETTTTYWFIEIYKTGNLSDHSVHLGLKKVIKINPISQHCWLYHIEHSIKRNLVGFYFLFFHAVFQIPVILWMKETSPFNHPPISLSVYALVFVFSVTQFRCLLFIHSKPLMTLYILIKCSISILGTKENYSSQTNLSPLS